MAFIRILVIFSFLFLICCSKNTQNEQPKKQNQLNGPPLVIGILPEESPKVIYEKLLPIKLTLENALHRPVFIDIAKDFNHIEEKIKSNQLHLLITDPATYCELKWNMKNKIQPLLKPEGAMAETTSVFVTKEGKKFEKIFDALGTRLALGDEKSSFSYLIPLSMLKDVGISLKDFKSVDIIQKEQRIALSVLIGDYDIGAMSEITANQYLKDGLKIIRKSEPTPRFLIAKTDALDTETAEKIKKVLTENNKELFNVTGIQKFVKAEDRDFDYIRVLIRNLKGKDYIEYKQNTIKVAILPLYSPLTIFKRYDPLMRYLSEKTGYEFKLVIPRDFEEFISIVSSGKVQFSYQNPYVYSIISKKYPVKVLATTVGEDCATDEGTCGREKFRGVIIVRKDSNINKIQDLKGKKIMIVSPTSAAGFLSQKIYLEKKGFDLKRDFKLIDAKRQEKVIIGVYKGQADAGFVRESALTVWSEEVDMSKIKILAYTDFLPNWPFCAVNNKNLELTEKVKKIITHIEDPSILKKAKIKGFKDASDEDFTILKRFID